MEIAADVPTGERDLLITISYVKEIGFFINKIKKLYIAYRAVITNYFA